MLFNQAAGLFVADGDGRRALALLRVQQVKAGVAALVDPEAFHLALPLNDVDADPVSEVEH